MKVDYQHSMKLNNWKKIQPENSAEKITLQKIQLKLNENEKDSIKTNWKIKFNPWTLLKKQPFRRLKIKWKLKHFNETKEKKILKFKEICFSDTFSDKFP